jgi:hypothetical protein
MVGRDFAWLGMEAADPEEVLFLACGLSETSSKDTTRPFSP